MTNIEPFHQLYEQIREQVREQVGEQVGTIDPFKKKAWEAFSQKGLPTKKWESFRYVPLEPLYSVKWALPKRSSSLALPQQTSPTLVFVDGIFNPSLSTPPDSLIVLPLKEALISYGALLHKRFAQEVEQDPNPFVLLNHALSQGGLFLYLPPHQKLAEPLHFLFVQTTAKTVVSPRIDLFIGKGGEATTFSTYVQHGGEGDGGEGGWSNGVFHITLEEGGKLSHVEEGSGIQKGVMFQGVRAYLKRGSSFRSFAFSCGRALIRRDLQVTLEGEKSETELKGLDLLEEKGERHTHILVHHKAPHCRSYQHYKAVVASFARAGFNGKIYVEKEAQKTDAYQLINNLLLGEKAKAMSQPNLEIFADDVKASHGATCIKPNEEELFYLNTRGLDAQGAKKELVRGFCKELIEAVSLLVLRANMAKEVEHFLPKHFLPKHFLPRE